MSYRLLCYDCYMSGVAASQCSYALATQENGKNYYILSSRHKKHQQNPKTTIPDWLVEKALNITRTTIVSEEVARNYDFGGVNHDFQKTIEALVESRSKWLSKGNEGKVQEIDNLIQVEVRKIEQYKKNVVYISTGMIDGLVKHDSIIVYALLSAFFLPLPVRVSESNCADLVLTDQDSGAKYKLGTGERIKAVTDETSLEIGL